MCDSDNNDEQIIYWTYIKRPKCDDDDDGYERPSKRPRPPDIFQPYLDELHACYRAAFTAYEKAIVECDRRKAEEAREVSKCMDPAVSANKPVDTATKYAF